MYQNNLNLFLYISPGLLSMFLTSAGKVLDIVHNSVYAVKDKVPYLLSELLHDLRREGCRASRNELLQEEPL